MKLKNIIIRLTDNDGNERNLSLQEKMEFAKQNVSGRVAEVMLSGIPLFVDGVGKYEIMNVDCNIEEGEYSVWENTYINNF